MKQTKNITAKGKEREETERRLIQAAEQVFSEVGYDAGSTRMIAEKAGINLGLISRYFGNKRGLLIACLENLLQDMSTDLPYKSSETLEEELDMYIAFSWKEFTNRESLYRILIIQSITDPTLMPELQKKPGLDLVLNYTNTYLNDNTVNRFARLLKIDAKKYASEIRSYVSSIDYVIMGVILTDYFVLGISKKNALATCKKSVRNIRFSKV